MSEYEFKTDDIHHAAADCEASNDNTDRSGPYAALLGPKDWSALPAAVRARFSQRPHILSPTIYRGYVISTDYSRAGYVLAQLLRCIGGPLPLTQGHCDTPASVIVSHDPDSQTQYWTRHYERHGQFPHVVQSAKQFSGPTGLEENVGFGIGMALNLSAEDGALVFSSDQYFLKLFGRRIPLPRLFMPGRMRVSHTDYGDGWFEFRLTLKHSMFGELLDQRAMFCDEGDY